MLRNSWLKWFENRMHDRRLYGRMRTRRGRTASQNRPAPVRVGEHLETRTLLTTYLVDTTDDVVDNADGLTSLREAIEFAEANTGADEIRFAAGLEGEVFNITLGPLPTITESLGIFGTIGDAQTINGAGLIVNASGTGNLTTFAVNSVNINLEPTGAGLLIEAVDDGVADVTIFNSQITNSAEQGLKFVAHTGGIVNLTLGVVGVFSNGDVAPSEGILGEIGVDPAGAESLTTPGQLRDRQPRFCDGAGRQSIPRRLQAAGRRRRTSHHTGADSRFDVQRQRCGQSAVRFAVLRHGRWFPHLREL